MSGRRSSSAEGSPAGITGTASTKSVGAIVSSAGGTPISTAIACSSCARITPTAIAWAWVLCSWASACDTSDWAAVPAAYWLRVMRKDSANAVAELSSSRFSSSATRNCR